MPEHISPLRQRLIDDMSLRNMSALTQAAYIRAPEDQGGSTVTISTEEDSAGTKIMVDTRR